MIDVFVCVPEGSGVCVCVQVLLLVLDIRGLVLTERLNKKAKKQEQDRPTS
jgi:hypothetical protein